MNKRYTGRPSLKWLFEQAAPAPAAPAASPTGAGNQQAPAATGAGTISTPWITSDIDQNLKSQGPNRAEKNGNPANDINMLEGESPDKLWKIAMELLKYGRSATAPQVAIDNYGFEDWKGESDGAKWLTSIGGPEVLKSRIAKIAGTAAGLVPRAEMPVLSSKQSIEIKNPETGETIASGPQHIVAGDLLSKGAVDVAAPFASSEAPKSGSETEEKKLAETFIRSLNNSNVSYYVIREYCKKNGFELLTEQDDPFPTNLTGNDKDSYLTKGLRDGNPNDDVNKIPTTKDASAAVSALGPSQSDVYLSKALGFAFGKKYEGDPVIIAGNKILDGHHRWAAANLGDPSFQMKGIQIGEPSDAGVTTALKALRSIGNAMGNKQKGGKDENLKESSWSTERWQVLAGIRKR